MNKIKVSHKQLYIIESVAELIDLIIVGSLTILIMFTLIVLTINAIVENHYRILNGYTTQLEEGK